MKKALVFALVLLVACAAAAAAWPKSSVGTSASSGQALSCKGTLKIALVTPLTGSAAFLGVEQASWAKYAVKTLARQLGLKITLLLGDTPVDRGQAAAQALARKYAADSRVVGIIGPATFGTVVYRLYQELLPRRSRSYLAVRDAHGPDDRDGAASAPRDSRLLS